MPGAAPNITVYSCHFGQYEPFNPEATAHEGGHARVVFTDHRDLAVPGVQFRYMQEEWDSRRQSRLVKMRPHLFFADQDWVIYIDNSAKLKVAPAEIIARIEADYPQGAPAGRYLFRHPKRDCAYGEARACKRLSKLSRADYKFHVGQMQEAGFPVGWGLFSNTLMIQKMGDAATDALNDAWFDHYMQHSGRDQVSLPFMLWKMAYPVRVLPFSIADVAVWPYLPNLRRRRQQARRQAAQPAETGTG